MAVAFDCGIPGSPMEGVGLLGRVALVGRAVQDERRDRGRRVRRRVGRAAGGRLVRLLCECQQRGVAGPGGAGGLGMMQH